MDAYAVATIFGDPQDDGSNKAWSKIIQAAEHVDLSIQAMLHFSWHVSIYYHMAELSERLMRFTQNTAVFDLQTAGLGLFTSESPVLYLPIVKTPEIAKLHQDLWELILPASPSALMYYSPQNWVPHITLIDEAKDVDRICQFQQALLFEPMSFRFRVDNLAVIYRNGSEEGDVQKFMFGGNA